MNHTLAKDSSGKGSWILIIDCPWKIKHVIRDYETGITGPSFAKCVECEYQQGINLELRDPINDWSCQPYPDRLVCGFKEDRQKLKLVKGKSPF
jgi:hypothetical protein